KRPTKKSYQLVCGTTIITLFLILGLIFPEIFHPKTLKKMNLYRNFFIRENLLKNSIIFTNTKFLLMLKKYLSYILPIKIYQKKSQISKNLEVTWNNGQLVLDSENTNYSFGSLQRILRKGLKYIGFKRIQNFENILVLGVAGGSVIK